MEEHEFLQLIEDMFDEIDIKKLYKIEIKDNGKIKIKYTNIKMPGVMCEDTLTLNF